MRAEIALRETTEVRLAANSLLRIEGDSCGVIIISRDGSCWITQEGDPEDHFLENGESFTINRAGLVMVVALADAGITLKSE